MHDVVHGSVCQEHLGPNDGPLNWVLGIVLGLDGFSPFKSKFSRPTNLMAARVTCLNLDPILRNEKQTQWISFMMQGKAEPNPLFGLEIIADELMYAHHFGCHVLKDASQPELGSFHCKVRLLMLRADYRGMQKLCRRAGSPSKFGACYKCHVTGLTQQTTGFSKTLYPGIYTIY